jgi:hypothetical protein
MKINRNVRAPIKRLTLANNTPTHVDNILTLIEPRFYYYQGIGSYKLFTKKLLLC